jgi:hypothetical protein
MIKLLCFEKKSFQLNINLSAFFLLVSVANTTEFRSKSMERLPEQIQKGF